MFIGAVVCRGGDGGSIMDKNYWLKRWYERRFLNRLWEIYPDGEWSWKDIMNYVKSRRFQNDLFSDLAAIAEIEYYNRHGDNDD